MINPMDGGIVQTIIDDHAFIAADQPLSYPLRIISGPKTRDSIAASALAEPETPPMSVESTQDT